MGIFNFTDSEENPSGFLVIVPSSVGFGSSSWF